MTASQMDIDDHRARSAYVRRVVQRTDESDPVTAAWSSGPRRTIMLFWDDLQRLPSDVSECIDSWKLLKAKGFDIHLFDSNGAREFIASHLGIRYENAYQRTYHPAMQSDYFRLCYILVKGGCYIDADDVHKGPCIDHLFDDGRLKLQPLCYDADANQMVPPEIFTVPGADSPAWIFYFNNNPLLAGPEHPIIERALANATTAIEEAMDGELPEIQSTTGPGNLTRSIVELGRQNVEILSTLHVLRDWENVACSRWPLSYRRDARNWRLSNCRTYQQPGQDYS